MEETENLGHDQYSVVSASFSTDLQLVVSVFSFKLHTHLRSVKSKSLFLLCVLFKQNQGLQNTHYFYMQMLHT